MTQHIEEDILKSSLARYGKRILPTLSEKLSAEPQVKIKFVI